MKTCDGCHRSPALCVCPKIQRRPCVDCGRRLVRSEYELIEDERGFVKGVRCKNKTRCTTPAAAGGVS